ncbi:MAG: hypothetical protein NVSMB57_13580 [Actinomycetota bacterium]
MRVARFSGLVKVSVLALASSMALSSLGASAATTARPVRVHKIHAMLTLPAQLKANMKANKDCVLPVAVLVTCASAGLPLTTDGGPIHTAPAVYIIRWHWSSDPSGQKAYQENFFKGVGGSSWMSSQTQYCDHATVGYLCGSGARYVGNQANVLKGTWDDNVNPMPADPTDEQVADEAVRAAIHFGNTTAASNRQTQYIIDLPKGVDSAFAKGYCAYHSDKPSSQGDLAYTYFPYMTDGGSGCGQYAVNSGSNGRLDGVSIVGGHEYAETVTDATPNSGWHDATGSENGDKCAFIFFGPGALKNTNFANGSFAVQSLWSNKANFGAGGCVS